MIKIKDDELNFRYIDNHVSCRFHNGSPDTILIFGQDPDTTFGPPIGQCWGLGLSSSFWGYRVTASLTSFPKTRVPAGCDVSVFEVENFTNGLALRIPK